MNDTVNSVERVVGFDSHPDSFTAALLRGPTPAAATVEKTFNKVPLSQLQSWAKKNTTGQDLIVLEASGNSFRVVRLLAAIGRKAKVLESCHLGKLKEAHANNDKISAVRIGKAYLAGTAKEVWVPDLKTQERRDWLHAYRKACKRTTQMSARVRSYLSDNGVRLKKHSRLTATLAEVQEQIRKAREWSPRQWQVLEMLLLDLRQADEQRRRWRSLVAQEVLSDPQLISLVRLCGVREVIAFALGAFIGEIQRFAHPKKLVKYVGLNPIFDDSGQSEWSGGIGGHGNKYLRCLLMEAAQAILRSGRTPLAQWGRKLLARKGAINLAVAAMARKLTVSIWYLMMGRWTTLEDIDESLKIKVGKILTSVGQSGLENLAKTRKAFREQVLESLRSKQPAAKEYVLGPDKKFLCTPA
jgi:transposase